MKISEIVLEEQQLTEINWKKAAMIGTMAVTTALGATYAATQVPDVAQAPQQKDQIVLVKQQEGPNGSAVMTYSNGYTVKIDHTGTKVYNNQNKLIKTISPEQLPGLKTVQDLQTGKTTLDYQQGPMKYSQNVDQQGKPIPGSAQGSIDFGTQKINYGANINESLEALLKLSGL